MKPKHFILSMISSNFILCFIACHSFHQDYSNTALDSSALRGKILATTYCKSCHQLPDPALIDKKTWIKYVLPGMAPRLGIFRFKGREYPSKVLDRNIGRKFYPSSTLISDDQWQDIIDPDIITVNICTGYYFNIKLALK